ncbi:MAG: ABC transporter permease subunit [Candidatus Heimdallarchaeota archaeon]|nr:ABC transporter permease subunit [Candidatus Heimdallarchaeota archaeon]
MTEEYQKMESYQKLSEYKKKISWTNRIGPLYRISLGKLWKILIKDKKTWIFESMMLIPIIVGPIVALTSGGIYQEDYFSLFIDVMFMGYIGLIIPLFTMYVASMLFSEEISDRTITYLTIRPVHRIELIIIKYLSYLTIVPLFTAIGSGLVYLSFALFGGFEYISSLLWFILGGVIATATYGALFLFIGLLFKRPLWFGLFFVFIWEFLFANFSRTLNQLTIAYYVKSLIVKGPPVDFRESQAYLFKFYSGGIASTTTLILVLLMVIVISLTLAWSKIQGDTFKIPYQAARRPGGWKYYLKEIRTFLISIGIILIAVGAVVGPVSGLQQEKTSYYDQEVDINPYPFFSNQPGLSDMGFGSNIPLTYSSGDVANISFRVDFVSHQEYSMYAVLTDQESFQNFVDEARTYWVIYQRDYWEENNTDVLYQQLVNNYTALALNFVLSTPKHVKLSENYQAKFNLQAEKKTTYSLAVLVIDFDVQEQESFYCEFTTIIESSTFRRVGFIFGLVLLSCGILALGLASYSFLTYSSADEIKRYEEQVKQYE